MVKGYYKTEGYLARKSIGFAVRRASHTLTAGVEEVFTGEVTFVQWVILMNLRDGLADTATGLCNNIRYDSGALTRVIDQMEEKGLLSRQRSDADRRVVSLAITEKGTETVETLLPLVVAKYNTWLEVFTKDEVNTLIHLLTKLTDRMNETSKAKEVKGE